MNMLSRIFASWPGKKPVEVEELPPPPIHFIPMRLEKLYDHDKHTRYATSDHTRPRQILIDRLRDAVDGKDLFQVTVMGPIGQFPFVGTGLKSVADMRVVVHKGVMELHWNMKQSDGSYKEMVMCVNYNTLPWARQFNEVWFIENKEEFIERKLPSTPFIVEHHPRSNFRHVVD